MERICETPECNNLGQYKEKHPITGKVQRRRLCYGCRHPRSGKKRGRKAHQWKLFKEHKCNKCEYCGWEGPCDIHRPDPKGKYEAGNMKSICPNCHRLLDLGLTDDPYTI